VLTIRVLDVAPEALAQGYHKNTDLEPYADAMAWVCRALGNSGNGRYKGVAHGSIQGSAE